MELFDGGTDAADREDRRRQYAGTIIRREMTRERERETTKSRERDCPDKVQVGGEGGVVVLVVVVVMMVVGKNSTGQQSPAPPAAVTCWPFHTHSL